MAVPDPEYYTDRQDRSDIDDEHFEADQIAGELREIRRRAYMSKASASIARHIQSAGDVPRLLAALDAALALTDEWKNKADELWGQIRIQDLRAAAAGSKGAVASVNTEHATALQEAISRALLGKDGTDA